MSHFPTRYATETDIDHFLDKPIPAEQYRSALRLLLRAAEELSELQEHYDSEMNSRLSQHIYCHLESELELNK